MKIEVNIPDGQTQGTATIITGTTPPVEPPVQPPVQPPVTPPPAGVTFDVPWGGVSPRYIMNPWGTQVMVARIVVPPGVGPFGANGRFNIAEYGGQPWKRLMVVSLVPGDMNTSPGACIAADWALTPNISFNVGTGGGQALLQAGQTYYVNAISTTPDGYPVTGGDYPASFQVYFPN